MHILTNISKWIGANNERIATSTTSVLINPLYISEMIVDRDETRVFFCDNASNSREGLSKFWCDSSIADIVGAADSTASSKFLTVDVFRNNDPAKSTNEINIPYENLICAYANNANSSLTWVFYDRGETTQKLLVNLPLNEISDDAMKYTDTIDLAAGVDTIVTTTLARIPYSIQLLDSDGNDISELLVSITLSGGFYVLTFYSVDALTDCNLYILY